MDAGSSFWLIFFILVICINNFKLICARNLDVNWQERNAAVIFEEGGGIQDTNTKSHEVNEQDDLTEDFNSIIKLSRKFRKDEYENSKSSPCSYNNENICGSQSMKTIYQVENVNPERDQYVKEILEDYFKTKAGAGEPEPDELVVADGPAGTEKTRRESRDARMLCSEEKSSESDCGKCSTDDCDSCSPFVVSFTKKKNVSEISVLPGCDVCSSNVHFYSADTAYNTYFDCC